MHVLVRRPERAPERPVLGPADDRGRDDQLRRDRRLRLATRRGGCTQSGIATSATIHTTSVYRAANASAVAVPRAIATGQSNRSPVITTSAMQHRDDRERVAVRDHEIEDERAREHQDVHHDQRDRRVQEPLGHDEGEHGREREQQTVGNDERIALESEDVEHRADGRVAQPVTEARNFVRRRRVLGNVVYRIPADARQLTATDRARPCVRTGTGRTTRRSNPTAAFGTAPTVSPRPRAGTRSAVTVASFGGLSNTALSCGRFGCTDQAYT